MSLRMSTTTLDTSKDLLNQAVRDATRKIAEAKHRIKELERAREVFRKNARERVAVPGSYSLPLAAPTAASVTAVNGDHADSPATRN